ncbi:solute carrier organic anion transporter family member 2A1-like [Anneissia japonica]|uniref:solute carrier organic anion transporter family member 2A1-like n=1 Tax=Anneissia japonica TaxID=1529436 RepID=UPI0014255EB2|nr:solute carrier organic anion transporter family member 2A1-like [Anneissia japonica]
MSNLSRPSDSRYASLDTLDVDRDTKCGIGRFTPSCLQFLANPKVFLLFLVPTMLLKTSVFAYTGGVLTTLEKEFQLSSTESGFLSVIDDITSVIFVLFVSFLGHNAHRPRWISSGTLLTGIGIFICAFPHFSKDVTDLSKLNGNFSIPDYCFLRNINHANFDPSKIPGFDPSIFSGFDPSKLPTGFDPSKLPEGFDPSKLPEGFDPSKLPEGFDPSKLPEGFDPSKLPTDFDVSQLPQGTDSPGTPDTFKSTTTFNPFDPLNPKGGVDPSKLQNNTENGVNIRPGKQNNMSSIPFFPGGLPFASNGSLSLFNDCDNKGTGFGSTTWLIIGFILQGIGGAILIPISLTYIDDSVPTHQTVFYIALIFVGISLGPISGYMFTALSLSLFVDFDRVDSKDIPDLNMYDPRWIGAWWLGYLIIGTVIIILSIPLFLFPKKMPARFKVDLSAKKESEADVEFLQTIRSSRENTNKGVLNIIKSFFQAMKRLITNPSLISFCLGASAELAIVSIFVAFIIKYVITQFGVTPVTGTIIVGSVIAPCNTLGNLFAGTFCRKFKLGTKKTSLFLICGVSIGLCLFPVLMFVGCNNPNVAGFTTPFGQASNQMKVNGSRYQTTKLTNGTAVLPGLKSACNADCFCSAQMFLPVCGSDGVTYTSACHAGCSQKSGSKKFNPFDSDTIYTGCTCISDPDSKDGYGRAVSGRCSFDCSTLPMYVILTAILMISSSLLPSPSSSIMLRIVADEDRSVALGFQQLSTKVIGYFPAPIYFGAIINSVCLLWQTTCGDEGACLMYDIEKYRYFYFSLLIGLKMISLAMFTILYCTLKAEVDGNYKHVNPEQPGSPLSAFNGEASTQPKNDHEEDETI